MAGSGFTSLLKMTMSSVQVLQSAPFLICALPQNMLLCEAALP